MTDTEKGPNEVYCTSCGEPIKEAAEICPECGVRNDVAGSSSVTGASDSDASDTIDNIAPYVAWIGGVLFVLAGLGAMTDGTGAAIFGGLIVLAGGAFALPPIRNRLTNSTGRSFGRATVVIVVLVAVVAGMTIAPTEDTGSSSFAAEGDTAGGGSGGDGSGSESQQQGLQVKVIYSGSWSGAVGTTGNMRTVDGSGTTTLDVDDGANIVSANAQKQDSGSSELTIQIIKNGNVVDESSTTASYGVAQVSANV